MRKLIVLGLLLAASTGCGRGWFPHLFRGASCNGLCSTPAPTLQNDCEGCNSGYSSGYASYDGGEVVSGGMETNGYDMNTVIGSGPIIGSAPMTGIQGGQIVAPGQAPAVGTIRQ